MDATYHMYYVDVFNLHLQDLEHLETLNIKAMDVMKKECMIFFHKRLLVCDPIIDHEFFHQIKFQQNSNPKAKTFTKIFKLFTSSHVTNEQKVSWLKQ
jgi:hypothetical protein